MADSSSSPVDALAEAERLVREATPGPWDAKPITESGHRSESWFRVWLADDHLIEVDTGRSQADAALIAAAPRLLASLAAELRKAREVKAAAETYVAAQREHTSGMWKSGKTIDAVEWGRTAKAVTLAHDALRAALADDGPTAEQIAAGLPGHEAHASGPGGSWWCAEGPDECGHCKRKRAAYTETKESHGE